MTNWRDVNGMVNGFLALPFSCLGFWVLSYLLNIFFDFSKFVQCETQTPQGPLASVRLRRATPAIIVITHAVSAHAQLCRKGHLTMGRHQTGTAAPRDRYPLAG